MMISLKILTKKKGNQSQKENKLRYRIYHEKRDSNQQGNENSGELIQRGEGRGKKLLDNGNQRESSPRPSISNCRAADRFLIQTGITITRSRTKSEVFVSFEISPLFRDIASKQIEEMSRLYRVHCINYPFVTENFSRFFDKLV